MNTQHHRSLIGPLIPLFCVGALVTQPVDAELIRFVNTNPDLEALRYYEVGSAPTVFGQSLDVTRGAFDQPSFGEIPVGSLSIVWFEGINRVEGDWIHMGPGLNTHIARADDLTEVIDPETMHPVGHIGPGDFDDGKLIGEGSNWTHGWVAMHTSVSTAPPEGVYFTDQSFVIGLRFLMDDGLHYGYAQFERSTFIPGDRLSIQYRPVRWGYETTAGVAVPSVGSTYVLLFGLTGCRRRR